MANKAWDEMTVKDLKAGIEQQKHCRHDLWDHMPEFQTHSQRQATTTTLTWNDANLLQTLYPNFLPMPLIVTTERICFHNMKVMAKA